MIEEMKCPRCEKPMLRGRIKSGRIFETVFWSEDGKSSWNPKNREPISLSEARAYYCRDCFITAIYELGDKTDQIAAEPESEFTKAFRETGKKKG
jgi:hypothetical protein